MTWIAKTAKLFFQICARVIVTVFAMNLVKEIIITMSEAMKTTADIAGSPKTQGLISIVTGGVWTYDGVMNAASDLLIIVSLLSGIVAIWGYFSGRKRKRLEDERKDMEHRARMRAYQKQLDAANKQEEAAQARVDLMTEIMANGKKNFDHGTGEIAEKIIQLDQKSDRRKTN